VIGTTTTQQHVSRARSSTARLLALFLILSLLVHGLFFPREWILFGFTVSVCVLVSELSISDFVTGTYATFGLTDALFLGMFIFSVLGMVHPVQVKAGFLEAFRWGILWVVYRLGTQISADEIAQKHLLQYIEWLAIVVALLGWLPWASKMPERLCSVFGYANATAAFLGAVVLLWPRNKLVQILLGISLFATGSRAGVGIVLVILIGQQLWLGTRSQRTPPFMTWGQRFQMSVKRTTRYHRELRTLFLGLVGMVLMMFYNQPAWKNLTSGGFLSSSWQERLVYYKDGLCLAWEVRGLPRAGGWMAFPTVQRFPYWTADPHSSIIRILLCQGFLGIISLGFWSVFMLGRAWKTCAERSAVSRLTEESEGVGADVRVWGALLFLILHSFVDADFSFGTLGMLFWMLLGSRQRTDKYPRPHFPTRNKLMFYMRGKLMVLISLIMCLISGSVFLSPALLDKEKIWNTQASLGREQNPTQSIALWNRSLNWDQTQISARREQTELLLKSGDIEAGLKGVEEVLRWQSLDPGAYEWAQSVIWDAAEVQRRRYPQTATMLYHWVQDVPQKIEGRAASLTLTDRLLWRGYRDFRPSEHVQLLAEYARQRQLALLLPKR
jgi:hypothetical protein